MTCVCLLAELLSRLEILAMLSAAKKCLYFSAVAALQLFLFGLVLPTIARSQQPPTLDSQIVEAKTAYLTAEVLYPKDDKHSFASELDTISNIASRTRLWLVYHPVAAEKADIIIKIVEDRTLGSMWTLTLHVYDPEDNRELYQEKREYVELKNDMHRLVNHLLDAVLEQRKLNREEARQEVEKGERDYETGVGPAQITCDNVKMFANRGAERRVKRFLNKGKHVTIVTPANSEAVIRIGDIVGYVDARCVQLLPVR